MMDWDDEINPETPTDRAEERVDYRLTFDRTERKRSFAYGEISGPDIPDARSGRGGAPIIMSSGVWAIDSPVKDSEPALIRAWFRSAICESIHEALEWFWVDGEMLLDPHGKHQHAIDEVSRDFGDQILSLIEPIAESRPAP